jgi:dephospho-CoA kinase
MAAGSSTPRRKIPVVGIVGGIGSGKSTLAKWVAERHPVAVIDADRIGHRLLEDPDVVARLRTAFGDSILNSEGGVERARLAALVFGTAAEHRANRARLESIVHPEIRRETERQIGALDPTEMRCVFLDAAVLLESGWRSLCDRLIFVDTPAEKRAAWVKQHRGWQADELARREASQWPLAAKRTACDATIHNDGTVAEGGERLWAAVTALRVIQGD